MLWLTFAILGIFSFFMKNSKFAQEGEYAQLTIIVMSIIVIFCVFDNMKKKISKIISISGYCVMLLVLMIDRYIISLSSGDADGFHLTALQKLNGNYSSNYGGVYTDILSIVYYLFGDQRIIGQYMNVLVVITTEIIVLQILKILKYDGFSENICIAMLALSPNMLLYDSFLLREALIQNLIAFSLYWFIRWLMYNEKVSFVFSIFFALLACFYHSGCIATVIGYCVFFSLYDFSNKKIKFRFSTIFTVLISIVFFIY